MIVKAWYKEVLYIQRPTYPPTWNIYNLIELNHFVFCYCSILKFGVEIANDVKRIHKMCGCQVNGSVDLRYLYIRSGLQV